METRKKWNSRKLAVIALLSVVGGVSSFAVGYAGKLLSFVPLGPATGQLLSGLHVFWLILIVATVKQRGTATMAGALKGIVEMLLPNHLGPFVFLMSLLEGAVVDLSLLPFKKPSTKAMVLASGLSASSNIFVIQAFQLLPTTFSVQIYGAMYFISFFSGMILGGYLSVKSINAVKPILQKQSNI